MFIIFYTLFHEQNSACADLLHGSVMLQDFTKEFPIARVSAINIRELTIFILTPMWL